MTQSTICAFLLILATIGVVPPAAAPPAVPANPVARGTAPGTVTVTWNASAGATGYRVYADVDPIFLVPPSLTLSPNAHLVATVTGTSADDAGLAPLVRRYYAVIAVNGDGESLPVLTAPTIVPAQPDAPIFGVADLHTHQFSNLGFGRKVVWGNAFSPAGIFDALPFCDAAHGTAGAGDIVGNFLSSGFPLGLHHTAGGDALSDVEFDGWPAFNSYTHQQMYYEWLRRAFEGGLRLIVVHAVNNKLLCEIQGHDPQFSCEDMNTVDDQLTMAKNLESFIDGESGGPGLGWYRVAYSATEARHIINSGRMAVVLGLEVDNLFSCGLNSSCTMAQVTPQLDAYYAKGVRHLFPVHVFDNAFGGAALYTPLFNYGNRLEQGTYFTPRECSAEGFHYKQSPLDPLITFVISLFGLTPPSQSTLTAECNSRTLQPLGDSLVRAMMTRKMIVDIDHMSALTAAAALQTAEDVHYPGVVGGHTGILSIASGQFAAESWKTPAQLARIRALGGMIGAGLGGDRASSSNPDGILMGPGSTVINDCGHSSKTFAQNYLAGVSAFGGPSVAAVGIGSDLNGLSGAPGPRFGGNACWHDSTASPQAGGVVYPFSIFAPPGVDAGHLGRSTSPARFGKPNLLGGAVFQPWDFNTDGLAHVGLLPDFIQDLRSVGVTDAQLQPLFRSAEAYVHMWELAEATNINPPAAAISQSPAANASGWNAGDVTVTMIGTPAAGGASVTNLIYTEAGAVVLGPTTVAGASAQTTVSQEGTTEVSVTARDAFNNTSSPATRTVRIDKTAPSVTCQTPDAAWHPGDVALGCIASDATSGLANGGDASFALSTAVAAGSETAAAATGSRQVLDLAGNAATAGPITGNMIDKRAPAISIVVPAGATYVVNQSVAANYGCTDGGSGVRTCAGPVASGTSIDTTHPGTTAFTVNAADNVGNASAAASSYTVGYAICPQYDASRIKRAGSVVPIKLELCDAAGNNLSSASIIVTATGVSRVGATVTGAVDDAGNANPDSNFRFDSASRTYIFNLSTTGLTPGTWTVNFTVTGDPTVHSAGFQIQ